MDYTFEVEIPHIQGFELWVCRL